MATIVPAPRSGRAHSRRTADGRCAAPGDVRAGTFGSVPPTLILAAHGTTSLAGLATTAELAAATRTRRPGLAVAESYVDVAAPTFHDVLASVTGPVVVVPVLLSGGYHVHVDIPAVVGSRAETVVTPALGPGRGVSRALADRLDQARAGRSPGACVALVAAGSSDAAARADVETAAADLATVLGRPVHVAVLTGEGRSLADLVAALGTDVDVATYLLADGVFATKLRSQAAALGLATVSDPLGAHPALVDVILQRFDSGAP